MANNAIPVTTTFFFPFAAINLNLFVNCIKARVSTNTYMGTTGYQAPKSKKSDSTTSAEHKPTVEKEPTVGAKAYGMAAKDRPVEEMDPMLVASRNHANFHENVPFALIMAAGIELCGGRKVVLAGVLGSLTLLRIWYMFGISRNNQPWRAYGAIGTAAVMIGMGAWGTVIGLTALL